MIFATPPVVTANNVIRLNVSDVKRGSVYAFKAYNSNQHPVRIFLDLVRIVGDTKGHADLLDIRGSNAGAYCQLSSFRRGRKSNLKPAYTRAHCHSILDLLPEAFASIVLYENAIQLEYLWNGWA